MPYVVVQVKGLRPGLEGSKFIRKKKHPRLRPGEFNFGEFALETTEKGKKFKFLWNSLGAGEKKKSGVSGL